MSVFHSQLHKLLDFTQVQFFCEAIDLCCKGKVVLEVGGGSGLFSLHAARAGAKRVVCLEAAKRVAKACKAIVEKNGLSGVVTVINSAVANAHLPPDINQIDVIICSSACILGSSNSTTMIPALILARDKWLAPEGMLLPDTVRGYSVAIADDSLWDRYNYWNDVYGFDMSCMQEAVLREGICANVATSQCLTDAVEWCCLNLYATTVNTVTECDSTCCFTATETGTVDAMCYYSSFSFSPSRTFNNNNKIEQPTPHFDLNWGLPLQFDLSIDFLVGNTNFKLNNNTASKETKSHLEFSMAPEEFSYLWRQTVVLLPEKIAVVAGDTMDVAMNVRFLPPPMHLPQHTGSNAHAMSGQGESSATSATAVVPSHFSSSELTTTSLTLTLGGSRSSSCRSSCCVTYRIGQT